MYQFFLVLLVFSTGGEGSSRGEGEGGWGEGWREGGGGGQGTFHPPCHILHYHMVLALKGLRTTREGTTSQKGKNVFWQSEKKPDCREMRALPV